MLFQSLKSKNRTVYRKIALEKAKKFKKTMRDPTLDVYSYLVALALQSGLEEAEEGGLPPQYVEFAYLGSEDNLRVLANYSPQDLAINLLPRTTALYQLLYNLSRTDLELLRKYLDEYLVREQIRHSKSLAEAPILFAKKKDSGMRLCVNYQSLNKVTVKNQHLLPLITKLLERLASAKFYTKLDVKEAYYRVRIKKGNKQKTAFCTRYSSFKYTIMPFSLTNAPAQFQAYIY